MEVAQYIGVGRMIYNQLKNGRGKLATLVATLRDLDVRLSPIFPLEIIHGGATTEKYYRNDCCVPITRNRDSPCKTTGGRITLQLFDYQANFYEVPDKLRHKFKYVLSTQNQVMPKQN
jgi:hypothetical protein